jgi:FxsC-like protein
MAMTADNETLVSPAEPHPYFIVSYARVPGIAESPEADQLVGTFFDDLEATVRRYASARSGPINGFFDQRIPPGSDWKKSLTRALQTAQVFVPLYSVGYFAKSLPGREWACFHSRVREAGLADPEPRFMPVLWTPLSWYRDPPWLWKALDLGRDAHGYAQNGLRPMLKIRSYRDSYWAVLKILAKKIVVLAEEFPIRPSEVPDIDEMTSEFALGSPLAVFAIETARPASPTVATGRDQDDAPASDAEWRSFPGQEYPLTQYARQIVERFDFQAEISAIKAVSDPRTRRPGIILIDPRFIADEAGRSALGSAIRQLPRWVLPLVILDQPGDARIRDLANQVEQILDAAGALPTDSSRLAAQGVRSLDDFVSIIPRLVAEAERQYLRYRSGRVRSQPSSRRPSLRGPRLDEPASPPDEPFSAPDSQGETPDA